MQEPVDTTLAAPSIDAADVARFEALGDEWWSERGPMRQLHKLNPVRLAFIRDHMLAHFGAPQEEGLPLAGRRMLDIGCGGGILSEPLARLGARMTSIDPGPGNVEIARLHGERHGLAIDYRATSAEALAASGASFDAVLAMEVIEHVADVPGFIATATQLVAPGGLLFMATLNRTLKSMALAIVAAEYVLGWVPRGTHKWSQFVQPGELRRPLSRAGFKLVEATGVTYNPLSDRWSQNADMDVNYMIVARRRASAA
ncbi:MAG: bifunctional 2-polyprenyl-6-hydroxyphenol methylase/3-demethylubiquinol 3-O-methyltransferase UbiG [Hyphomicrobiales bacterium]|nr:bifunctional 2-polyprenyl-6-hydroxyphenol methylase/3-demethylubiquinol 3-O-methyltransferase UbiG [Hyphomicrobiales bacterium]